MGSCSELARSPNVAPPEMMALAGHSSFETTRIYIHAQPGQHVKSQAALLRLGGKFAQNGKKW